MKPLVVETAVPPHSKIAEDLPGAYFYDCYQMDFCHDGIPAMQLYLDTFAKTPGWVSFLMRVRNHVVGLFGLKNLGHLSAIRPDKAAQDYRIGERAGIFSLIYQSEQEVILCDSDKHLDVKVSVSKQVEGSRQYVAVTTVVHIHNTLGRAYMFFVGPAHKIIAPAVLRRAGT
ncbi:DUF2867 domain-containing protein [Undibacterium sp. TS12]|uniref:DUF2867 domain-containing protein n=1 Tax=Undibacterium sp. TS12 TaxID=2908202 RepID=UPI001F4D137A|nr:DUF2867 domain-containing protein [Undibacterium sp. TS12]MCH8619704.1 DUF2867 domain-containing protein [Undibacterium sp. TS12]